MARNLGFNLSKLVLMHFSPNQKLIDTSYTICGTKINCHNRHKDLGIILTSDLSWTEHHKSILGKAYGKLSMVKRSFSSLGSVATRKKTIYFTDTLIVAWANTIPWEGPPAGSSKWEGPREWRVLYAQIQLRAGSNRVRGFTRERESTW